MPTKPKVGQKVTVKITVTATTAFTPTGTGDVIIEGGTALHRDLVNGPVDPQPGKFDKKGSTKCRRSYLGD